MFLYEITIIIIIIIIILIWQKIGLKAHAQVWYNYLHLKAS